jgi:type II secretory pathway pseudopilin PulG
LVKLFRVNTLRPDKILLRVERRAAFTLVEVLLVVALLGFVAFVFVNSAGDLFRSKEPRADDIFWQGVTAARQLALEGNQIVTLRYDEEKHVLAWTAGASSGQTLAFPGKLLEFLPVTQQGSVLLGGQLTETDSIKSVRFYPDGCCDAFRAQVTDAAGRRSVLSIDPWTCAPMLAALPK